jgi:hypothetical protein
LPLRTAAFGDMPPVSSTERFFVMLALVLGVVALAYSLISLSVLVNEAQGDGVKFKLETDRMIKYMRQRGLPGELINDTSGWYAYRWEMSKGYDDLEMLRSLPLEAQIRAFHSVTLGMAREVDFLSMRTLGDKPFWMVLLQLLRLLVCTHTH